MYENGRQYLLKLDESHYDVQTWFEKRPGKVAGFYKAAFTNRPLKKKFEVIRKIDIFNIPWKMLNQKPTEIFKTEKEYFYLFQYPSGHLAVSITHQECFSDDSYSNYFMAKALCYAEIEEETPIPEKNQYMLKFLHDQKITYAVRQWYEDGVRPAGYYKNKSRLHPFAEEILEEKRLYAEDIVWKHIDTQDMVGDKKYLVLHLSQKNGVSIGIRKPIYHPKMFVDIPPFYLFKDEDILFYADIH